PGRSRDRVAPEQETVGRRSALRAVAPPVAYARVRQPGHQCAPLPRARGARLPGQRYRAGRMGAFDEERIDRRETDRCPESASRPQARRVACDTGPRVAARALQRAPGAANRALTPIS